MRRFDYVKSFCPILKIQKQNSTVFTISAHIFPLHVKFFLQRSRVLLSKIAPSVGLLNNLANYFFNHVITPPGGTEYQSLCIALYICGVVE